MKKVFAGLLFVAMIFFNVVILKPTAKGIDNSQLTVPDVTFYYDGETIYNDFFLKLDPGLIPTYKKMMLWDYPYPIIYTAFLLLMGQILFRKNLFSKIFFIAVFSAFAFDIAENLTQFYLINQLPGVHYNLATMMGIFTSFKWITVLFSLISVLVGLTREGIYKISAVKQ